ncbi:MAG: carboxypeptidase regulatory-like domain-containing protein, partial [Bacteroidales bacterium]|nr:carboxypeptidase regulatory-like domain-containing protein [Bacteroidales bacterium]
MKTKMLSVFFAFALYTFAAQAQQFSGTITNTAGDFLENAQIILQYPNGTPQNDTVYSDASGNYTVGEIQTGIKDLYLPDTKIIWSLSGNRLNVQLSNSAENRLASLYCLVLK